MAEVFLRAYERRDQLYGFGNGVDGWLFGVLRNVTREMHRADRRAPHRWLEVAPGDDPADRLIRADEVAQLSTALARLGRADQQILLLRFVERLTTEQLARRLGKRPGAVRMAQSRALARLRAALAARR